MVRWRVAPWIIGGVVGGILRFAASRASLSAFALDPALFGSLLGFATLMTVGLSYSEWPPEVKRGRKLVAIVLSVLGGTAIVLLVSVVEDWLAR